MKNKKGLIGKIILILFLGILIIVGITAYQAYNVYNTIMTEKQGLEEDITALTKNKDCTKITSIELRFTKIKISVNSACLNPIIKFGVKKFMADKPANINGQKSILSCESIPAIETEIQTQLKPIKDTCNNATVMNQINPVKNISA